MAESYREMEQRHAALDHQEEGQEWYARWAGEGGHSPIIEPDPPPLQDCTNCYYAEGDQPPYWCRAYLKFVFADGKRGCSGWSWMPVDEAEA